jgi:hypothetical protein
MIASPGMRLERLEPSDAEWDRLDALPGRTLFQTRAWVRFVAAAQGAEPVVAGVHQDGELAGWFTGLVVRRLGMRILGSPMPGWNTPSMGFTPIADTADVPRAAAALPGFAFGQLRCAHLEFADRAVGPGDLPPTFTPQLGHTFELGLGTDDEIFGAFTSACRRAVRKSEKVGVVVEEARDAGFAEEYHAQLMGVFARKGLTPTYGVDRVRHLVECLQPTGRLLLLRARNPEGESIATAIFPGFGTTAYFFGGASVRDQQIHRPNEALFWYAMRWWRDRGATTFDFGGGGDYKRRYGGAEAEWPSFRLSRYPFLPAAREAARALVAQRQRWRGRLGASAPADA